MKKLLSFICIFFLGVFSSFAEDLIPSRIKEVTLFANQAEVKRVAEVKVKKGLNELFLGLNPFNLDRDSVTTKIQGEGQIYSVQFKEIFLKEAPQKKISELEKKIEELRTEIASLFNQRNILNKEESFLDSFVDFSKTQIPVDLKTAFIKVNDLETIRRFLGENLREITRQREKLQKEIKETEKRMKILEKELASIKVPFNKTRKVIEIVFDSKKDQLIKIEIGYIVYNCRWQPFYKADVPLNLEEVNLTMFSKIVQKTGEDWKNIDLSISNVIPLRGVGIPYLNSWVLDVSRPRHKKREAKGVLFSLGKSGEIAEGLGDYLSMDEESAPPEANFVYARGKELPLSFEYELPQKLTIVSKEKETTLPLFSKKLKGEFFYYAVPKISPLTFLVCKTISDKELLSGLLNVYFDNYFVGKTYLREKQPGEDFNFNLGADREVKIKREKIKDKVDETFFAKIERKKIIRNLSFKITAENLKNKAVKVKILDNIPVPRTDKIVVKNLALNPQPVKRNYQDKEGVNLWELNLGPKEKKEITIEFTLIYTKGIPIYGL
ncbi:MAG: mucoidy inhibitor MuiA family protein [Candidatus Omnitrophica bacterium]|nr:mucoidy inhibitor MuiA family protein [Candidatus Omnitrophota bacterium]